MWALGKSVASSRKISLFSTTRLRHKYHWLALLFCAYGHERLLHTKRESLASALLAPCRTLCRYSHLFCNLDAEREGQLARIEL
jgi:hypothetical protein